MSKYFKKIVAFVFLILIGTGINSREIKDFKVIAFYTGKNDKAHISFVNEANQWFKELGKKYHYTYDSTNDCSKMTFEFLSKYDVVIFLDSRPDSVMQRKAFQEYMENASL